MELAFLLFLTFVLLSVFYGNKWRSSAVKTQIQFLGELNGSEVEK